MSPSHRQSGTFCRRGLAICLVGVLSVSAWQTAAEATCGDYLMSHGDVHQPDISAENLRDLLAGTQFPVVPSRCPNGDCRSQDRAPSPVGSTADTRIVDDLRSFGWLNGLKSENRDSSGGRNRPADEPLPESPLTAELERPPQIASV